MAEFENLRKVFIAFHVSIQVVMQMFKYYHYMLSKFKAVQKLNNVFFAIAGTFLEFFEQPNFDICVVDIEFFVFSYFCGDNWMFGVAVVNAFDYLAECPLIYNSDYFIAVAQLFA